MCSRWVCSITWWLHAGLHSSRCVGGDPEGSRDPEAWSVRGEKRGFGGKAYLKRLCRGVRARRGTVGRSPAARSRRARGSKQTPSVAPAPSCSDAGRMANCSAAEVAKNEFEEASAPFFQDAITARVSRLRHLRHLAPLWHVRLASGCSPSSPRPASCCMVLAGLPLECAGPPARPLVQTPRSG